MNLLSLLSFFNTIVFITIAVYALRADAKSPLNRVCAMLHAAFAIWSFSMTFFYAARTAEEAWISEKISSIGWILFAALSLHFILIQTNRKEFLKPRRRLIVLYLIPAILVIRNFVLPGTALAKELVQSASGLGWASLSRFSDFWWWLYVVYLSTCLFGGFLLLAQWSRILINPAERRAGRNILIINLIVMLGGMTTDLILPIFGPFLPPLANLFIILYALGFIREVIRNNFLTNSNQLPSEVILDTVMNPVLVLNASGRIVKCNRATCEWIGAPESSILSHDFREFLVGSYDRKAMQQLLEGTQLRDRELKVRDVSGGIRHILLSASMVKVEKMGFSGIVATIRDITERKKMEEELFGIKESYRHLADELFNAAHYDTLTKLPNRRHFFMRAMEFLVQHEVEGKDFAAIFMDLNGFKKINDQYGHAMGDLLLEETARRLALETPSEDFLARMGGDEFVMLLDDVRDPRDVELRSEAIKKQFEKGVQIGDIWCDVGIASGFALYSESGNLDAMLRESDQRMYADKGLSDPMPE